MRGFFGVSQATFVLLLLFISNSSASPDLHNIAGNNRPVALLLPNGNIVRSPNNPSYHTKNNKPRTSCLKTSKESICSLLTANFSNERKKGFPEVQSRFHGINNGIRLRPSRHSQPEGYSRMFKSLTNSQPQNYNCCNPPKIFNQNARCSFGHYQPRNHYPCMQSGCVLNQQHSLPYVKGKKAGKGGLNEFSNSEFEVSPCNVQDSKNEKSHPNSGFVLNQVWSFASAFGNKEDHTSHGVSNLEFDEIPCCVNEKSEEPSIEDGGDSFENIRPFARQVERPRATSSKRIPKAVCEPSFQELPHEKTPRSLGRDCERMLWAYPEENYFSRAVAPNTNKCADGFQIAEFPLRREAWSLPMMYFGNKKSILCVPERLQHPLDAIQSAFPDHGMCASMPKAPLARYSCLPTMPPIPWIPRAPTMPGLGKIDPWCLRPKPSWFPRAPRQLWTPGPLVSRPFINTIVFSNRFSPLSTCVPSVTDIFDPARFAFTVEEVLTLTVSWYIS